MFNIKKKLPSLLLLILLIGFPQISETIYTPSLPDIAKDLLTTGEKVQFTLSIYFIGFAVGVAIWGTLADRSGRRPSLLGAIVTYILGSLGCYLSYSIEGVLFFRFFQAVGASAGSVVGMTLIRDTYTGARRGQAFSSIGAALALSPALGPIVGGAVDQWFGWRANFLLLVAIGISLLFITGVRLEETRPEHTRAISKRDFINLAYRVCTDKKVLVCALFIGACNGFIFSYYAEAPFVFIDILGLTPGQYGFLGLAIAAATLCASAISHRLNARIQPEKIISIGVLIVLLGVGALFASAQSGCIRAEAQASSTALVILPIAILFIGIGVIIPNTISIALTKYQRNAGTAGSVFGLIYYLLISGFTALMGYFHDGTLHAMPNYFLLLGFLMLPGALSFHRNLPILPLL